MADLPESVAQQLMTSSTENFLSNNRDGRNASSLAFATLDKISIKNYDQVGTLEAQAVKAVQSTPHASPSVPQFVPAPEIYVRAQPSTGAGG